MIQPDNLPAQLREHALFCCWRYETRPGSDKPIKVPYNPRTGGGAQSTNPQTFAPLAVALEAAERRGYDGIGVGVFGSLGAIDIDHCLNDNGALSDMAEDIAATMGTYTEFSPSGKGLRILFTVPDRFQYDKARYYINNQRAGLEVYIAGATQKYVTVTGNTFTPGLDLEERGEQLAAVLEKYMVRPRAKEQPPAPGRPLGWNDQISGGAPVELDDLALIERAKRSKSGAAFSALWAGDTTGYKSRSEADIALCNALAWWTKGDAERVDRLFRRSGLMREKWDRSQSGSTYGAITIQNAVSTAQGVYDPTVQRPTAKQGFAPYEPFEPPDASKLPTFPVERLPPVLRDFAQAVAENLQVAVDMPSLQVLAVMALCLQGKFIINPKPGWVEPLNLYAVTVARPSDRKSPTVQACTRHLREWVREENAQRRPLVDEYNMKRAILTKRITGMIEQASKPTAKGKAGTDDIVEAQYQLADLEREEVKYLRLLANDVTPEALISLMADNNGKMAIVSDEGGIFDIAAGRYSDRVNLDGFLKAYSGTAIQIDRKGRASESIDHPALTMSLTVQPAVLEAIMGNADFSGRGFLARFLYSLPVSTVGHRSYEVGYVPHEIEVPQPQTTPVEHFKGVVGEEPAPHRLSKFQILILCPELHFRPFIRPHVSGFGGGVGAQLVEANSVVEDGAELGVYGFKIGLGVGLTPFVPAGQQFVLPRNHVFGGNFVDFPLTEVGQNLLLDDVLLGQPGVLFEPGSHILGVEFHERTKGHVQVAGGLHLKTAFPLLGLPLSGKAPLTLLLALPRPVPIPRHDVPCAPLFVLKYRHFRSLPFRPRRAAR